MRSAVSFPGLLEAFFAERLMQQRRASPHPRSRPTATTFRLLFQFVWSQRGTLAVGFDLGRPGRATDRGIPQPSAEKTARGSGSCSRNLRLTAIRSFFPGTPPTKPPPTRARSSGCLAIPNRRARARPLGRVPDAAGDPPRSRPPPIRGPGAAAATPPCSYWRYRRGCGVSELTSLRRADVILGPAAYVQCTGKGRKERCTPLAAPTVRTLRAWLREPPQGSADLLFPVNARGGRLSAGWRPVPRGQTRRGGPPDPHAPQARLHVLRHTSAMELLAAGVDRAVIALWLGHESVKTTQIYLDANLALKEEALRTTPSRSPSRTIHAEQQSTLGVPQKPLAAPEPCRVGMGRWFEEPALRLRLSGSSTSLSA